MRQDLELLLEEVERTLAARHFTVFRGLARGLEMRPQLEWDTETHPDFKDFLAVAEAIGVRLVVLNREKLDALMLEETLDRLTQTSIESNERRQMQRDIERIRAYEGFACSLQVSFDYDGLTYLYQVHTTWYAELLDLADDIDASIEEQMHPPPEGPYFSQN
jgi:hypothetical protein